MIHLGYYLPATGPVTTDTFCIKASFHINSTGVKVQDPGFPFPKAVACVRWAQQALGQSRGIPKPGVSNCSSVKSTVQLPSRQLEFHAQPLNEAGHKYQT